MEKDHIASRTRAKVTKTHLTTTAKDEVQDLEENLSQFRLSVDHHTPTKYQHSTTFDQSIFDPALVAANNIQQIYLDDKVGVAQLGVTGSLESLLNDLWAVRFGPAQELTQDEKRLLDFKLLETSDYVTGPDFLSDMNKIPSNNEAEWIARCHNKLSEFFRRFETWEASSVGSAQINFGIKPDRIFGFGLDARVFVSFVGNVLEFGCWPFLFIESKPADAIKDPKCPDFWKMPIIEAFGWEQQEHVLDLLKLSSEYNAGHVRLPLTFGIYYAGNEVNISVYFVHNDRKYFCPFDKLDLKTDAPRILRMFAIIKNYINLMHKSVKDAFAAGYWRGLAPDVPVQPKPATENERKSNNNNTSDKGTTDNRSTGPSSASTAPTRRQSPDVVQSLYNNHRTSVELVKDQQQDRMYIRKTTKVAYGKRECLVLGRLQGLSVVPTLLNKPVLYHGDTMILAMSWCQGVHPRNFTSRSELRAFMRAFLLALQQIHIRGIVHNDIKERNIIWDNTTQRVYLIDFGCATTSPGETNAYTPGYCAEDPVKTPASDVYSAGIVLMNLIFNIGIRSTSQAMELCNCLTLEIALEWISTQPTLSHGEATLCCEKSFELAREMIAKSANERITIDKALKHSFFAVPTSPVKRVVQKDVTLRLEQNVLA